MLLQTRLPDRSGTPELKQTTSSPHDAAGPLDAGTNGVRSSLHILADHLLGLDETTDLIVERALSLLEAFRGPRDRLFEFLLLAGRQLSLLLLDHAEAVYFRGELERRCLSSNGDLMH